jgi:hypothetical protein
MPTDTDVKDMARAQTRLVLGQSGQFLQMPSHEQQSLYRDVYEANYRQLARQHGLIARQMEADPMDPRNFQNQRIEQAGQLAADFIQDVDFPGFVRDLIYAVFRANIEVMHEQTNDFVKILKVATQSLAQFINKIDDTSTFAYLVEKEPDRFSFQLPPIPDDNEDGDRPAQPQQPVLTDKQGQPLDLGDNMVKAKIMDAKIAMAQEQRALLREVMLMGITRLVVEEGNINAAVIFDIKASEKITRTGQSVNEQVNTSGDNMGGSFFGLFGGGATSTERKTKITVGSAKGTGNTELAAKITGSVSIKFKTDYFKLDNFATMYGPQANAAPGAPAGVAPAAAPAGLLGAGAGR